MANTILTPTQVTREALRILHNKLTFVGSINRQYDSSFAKAGAKIGSQLKVRLPNQYTVRSGATLSAQDTTEDSATITVATQKGVDVNFTSVELTLARDDLINSDAMAATVDALKGLFHDSSAIAKQYKDGILGKTGGFTFWENEIVPAHTCGTRTNTTPLVNGASQSGASLIVDGF